MRQKTANHGSPSSEDKDVGHLLCSEHKAFSTKHFLTLTHEHPDAVQRTETSCSVECLRRKNIKSEEMGRLYIQFIHRFLDL